MSSYSPFPHASACAKVQSQSCYTAFLQSLFFFFSWLFYSQLAAANETTTKSAQNEEQINITRPAIFKKSAPIYETKSCFSAPFNSYDNWRAVIARKHQKKYGANSDKASKASMKFDQLFSRENFVHYQASLMCVTFGYKVDGQMVLGYAIAPRESAGESPILIYNRGGNGNFGGVVFGHMMAKLFPLAAQNFIIIGSQYRGTFQKNSKANDEFGGADVADVVALQGLIPHLVAANSDKLGMFGASRGGMQTFLAMRQMPNVKAVATLSGVSDLLADLNRRANMENVYKKRIPNYAIQKEALLKSRSVLYWLDELNPNVPILIMHGEQDKRVDVANALALEKALLNKQHKHKLVLFPEAGHSLSKDTDSVTTELKQWFQQYL